MADRPRRIFHIAKELNISHTEIIAFLNEEGITVGSHMAPIDDKDYHKILTEFSKDKESIERYRKEQMRKEIHDTRFRDTQKSAKKINLLSLSEQRKLETEEISKAKKELKKETAEKKAAAAKKRAAEKTVEKKSVSDQKKAAPESGKEEQPNKADQKNLKKETIQKEVQPTPKKVKLRKINLTDIESEIGKGIRRTRPTSTDSKAVAPEKSVEERVRQTLAKIDTKTKKKTYKKGKEIPDAAEDVSSKKVIAVPEYSSIDELAKYFEVTPSVIIQKCLSLGVLATINQRLDWDMIELLAEELNAHGSDGVEVRGDVERGVHVRLKGEQTVQSMPDAPESAGSLAEREIRVHRHEEARLVGELIVAHGSRGGQVVQGAVVDRCAHGQALDLL